MLVTLLARICDGPYDLAASTPGARYGVSMMLIPIRTLRVFAAYQGISVMPWNQLPRAMTGMPVGKSVIMPNGYCSSSSSLTVTSSRKFGRYRASFIDRRPQDDPGYRRAAFSV